MRYRSAVVFIFLTTAIFTGLAQAQIKNQPPADKVIGEKGTVATIADDGYISFLGDGSLVSLFGEEITLEVLGSESMISVIGEKGSEKVIGEKVIGEKIIGEKGSEKIIGEKGRVVRGVKTGRTVQFVGTDHAGASALDKLSIGNRVRMRAGNGTTSIGSTYTIVEPVLMNACCSVVKVSADGNVIAKNSSTGDSFYFNVPDPNIRASLHAGQSVATDRDGRWAFIRTTAVRGLAGQQATYSFPIRRDGGKAIPVPASGRR